MERTVINAIPQNFMLQDFDTATYSDFKFVCSDNVEIPCHRFVLAKASPWFKETFEKMKDSCNLPDLDSIKMMEILRFIYTGQYSVSRNALWNFGLIDAAHMFGLSKLAEVFVANIKEHITMENVFEIIKLNSLRRENPHARKVLGRCLTFIVE